MSNIKDAYLTHLILLNASLDFRSYCIGHIDSFLCVILFIKLTFSNFNVSITSDYVRESGRGLPY